MWQLIWTNVEEEKNIDQSGLWSLEEWRHCRTINIQLFRERWRYIVLKLVVQYSVSLLQVFRYIPCSWGRYMRLFLRRFRQKLIKWYHSLLSRRMAMAKLEVKKFTRTNDFSLWWLKMKALIVHQGLDMCDDPFGHHFNVHI